MSDVKTLLPSDSFVILGIDPGTTVMGYGLLEISNRKPKLLAMGVLDLRKVPSHYDKLDRIFRRVLSLVDEYHPTVLSIESPFYGKSVQSMLKLGRAQGVAMAAAVYRNVPVHEYAPLKVKMAITGNGQASKEQVAAMLQRMLHIPDEQMLPQMDASDAVGLAYCHFLQMGRPVSEKPFKSWKDFVEKNADRVKK